MEIPEAHGENVETSMDCFEAQNKITDAFDGILPPSTQTRFDLHVASCSECTLKMGRMRELLRILHQQPRAVMPLELREDPLAFPIRRLKKIFSNPKAVWKQLPVVARLLIEGGSIAAVVVIGIKLGPIAREMYERRMEKQLQILIAAEDLNGQIVPLSRGKSDAEDAELSDEVANDPSLEIDSENSSGVDVEDEVQVGQGEIWRFNLKTDAPALVRTKILKALKDAGIAENTAGIGGVEAPGGIQFDLVVPRAAIPILKVQLEKLAGSPNENLPFSETFTWYKNRSKKPIPSGTSRMVIWLSQI